MLQTSWVDGDGNKVEVTLRMHKVCKCGGGLSSVKSQPSAKSASPEFPFFLPQTEYVCRMCGVKLMEDGPDGQ